MPRGAVSWSTEPARKIARKIMRPQLRFLPEIRILPGFAAGMPWRGPFHDGAGSARLTQPWITMPGLLCPVRSTRWPMPRNDRGAASPDMQLDRLQLVLKRSPQQEATLQQLLRDMHTPGSANFHKWLTPDQFGQQFGPSDQDVQTIEDWLQTQGFQILKVNPGKQTLEVCRHGRRFAAGISYFDSQIRGQWRAALCQCGGPEIPVALAPVLGGFVSLNNFHSSPLQPLSGERTIRSQDTSGEPGVDVARGRPGQHVRCGAGRLCYPVRRDPALQRCQAAQWHRPDHRDHQRIEYQHQLRQQFSYPLRAAGFDPAGDHRRQRPGNRWRE